MEVVASAQGLRRRAVLFSLLWNTDVTEEIVTQKFLARMEGGIDMDMCTGSPQAAQRLAKLHADLDWPRLKRRCSVVPKQPRPSARNFLHRIKGG